MNKRWHASVNLVLLIAAVAAVAALASPAARAQGQGQPDSQRRTRAQLNVITSGGFAAPWATKAKSRMDFLMRESS